MTAAVIYLVENTANGKCYIGVTGQRPLARWRAHLSSARSGRGNALQAAIRKYGETAFTFSVIATARTLADALAAEPKFIQQECPAYNLTRGGEGVTGFKRTPDSIERSAAACRGRQVSNATRELLRQANVGKTHSAETRLKMSAARTGKPRPPEVIEKMRAARAGFKHTAEAKLKVSEANRRRRGEKRKPYPPVSAETRAKLSAAAKRVNSIQYVRKAE